MYLYNTTFVVERLQIEAWKSWLAGELISNIYDALPSTKIEVYEIDNRLEHTPGCTSFACLCKCETVSDLRLVEQMTEKIATTQVEKNGGTFVYFSTMMKKVIL